MCSVQGFINQFINQDTKNFPGRDVPSIDYEVEQLTFESIPNSHLPAIEDCVKAVTADRLPFVSGHDGIGFQQIQHRFFLWFVQIKES